MRKQHRFALALLLVLSVSCASVGTGDPVVVRAEDMLTNSLTIYDSAMQYHYSHSTTETPAVYQTFEKFRVNFQPAWRSLYNSVQAYKGNRTAAGANTVTSYLEDLRMLVETVQPYLGGK